MEIINVSDEIIEINVTEEVINIVTQTGAYPLPSNVFSVFGRVGNVVGQAGDYTTSLVGEGSNLYFTNARSRASISENITGINYDSASGIFSMASGYVIPTQVMLDAKQDDLNGTGIVKSTGGTITYLTDNTANWDAAYNDKINSASVTGTSTKTLTLNQQDGGTITASWSDADTGLTSVGLSMPAAFSVSGSPLTSNGTISVTGSGTTAQYVRGDGTLATFPTIANEAQRLITEVYNKTGATLTKGTIVYINGGQGNLPSITKAIATGDATSAQTYGVVQNDITNNNNGYVVVVGSILNIDTQAYADGTQLYLSGTIAGQFTSTKPYAPIHLVYVGIVTRSHPTQGVIEVRIQNGYEMDELHNVAAQSPNDGDILKYVSSTSLWTKTAGNTTNISEGTNLYYTQSRFDTAFGNKSTTNLTEGTNLYYTDGRARAAITGTLPISVTSGVVSISQAGGASNGFLSSTDWNTFNNKQAALSGTGFVKSTAGVISYDTNTYLTTISGIAAGGELSGTYANPTLVNSAVTGKILTGLNLVGGGTIADTDSILGAFGKVQNQISALVGGVMYEGTWNASTNTPTIVSSVGSKGDYYIVATAGSTNINGITSWNVGDWIIFNGSTWDKVDNTDAVSSVNGYTGAVSLVTSDVPESGSLYFTNARAIGSTLTGYTSGAGVVAATDTILQAIQKLNGNVSGLVTGVSSVFGRTGAVVAASGDYTTTQVTEGTNLYYTEARVNANTNVAANTAARHAAVTIGTANGLSLSTQALSLAAANTTTTGALTSTDWNTFNGKQAALNGTGFVKISGTTISYDNSTYLTTSAASSTYLPLAGGTLTGALSGTSASFSGSGSFGSAAMSTARLTITDGTSIAAYWKATNTNTATRDWTIITNNQNFGDFAIRQGNSQGADATSGTDRLFISNNGLIGIGTSNPQAFVNSSGFGNLVVGGGSGETGITIYSGTTGSSGLMFADATTGSGAYTGYIVYRHATDTMEIATGGGTPRLTITSSGNVGVGASPDYTFDVNKSIAGNFISRILNTSSTGFGLYVQTNDNTKPGIRIANASGGTAIDLFGSGAAKFNNSVTIGNAGSAGTYYLDITPSTSSISLQGILAGTGTAPIILQPSGGIVVIGGTTNTFIDYSANVARFYGGSSTNTFGLGAGGNIYYQGDNSQFYPTTDNARSIGLGSLRYTAIWAVNGTIQTSDVREKIDIVNSDLGLDFVTKLRPVSFKWKIGQNIETTETIIDEEGNEKIQSTITPRTGVRTHYGLIAQEVEELLDGKDFGGFIHDKESDVKGLRYDQFVPLLIKAIQELKAEIDELKNK